MQQFFSKNKPSHCGHHNIGWFERLLLALFQKCHCGCPPMNLFQIILFIIFGKCVQHKKNNKKTKVAYIGNYKSSCGVSTYNTELIEQLKNFCELKVFAEYESGQLNSNFVERCWERSDLFKKELIDKVLEFDPDIIHISHEYGIFPKAYAFTCLISIFKSYGYPVIATMHSVYEHLDKTVSEVAPNYLIVHTEEAKQCLIRKGLDANKIFVVLHGTECPENGELLPDLYNTWQNNHTIYHPGFLFYYKGHLIMLDVVHKLKSKYPDVHYIIQGSENPRNQQEHDYYYQEIVEKIRLLDLEHNVTLHRGFIDKRLMLNTIRTVKVCVLPYTPHVEHDVYAASGIGRIVITTETPLVTSKAHIFDDLAHIVKQADTINEFVEDVSEIFESNKEKEIQNKLKSDFLKIINWKHTAKVTSELYEKIEDIFYV